MPYLPHPHHRSAGYSAIKSQWIISVVEENACYDKAVLNNWIDKGSYWGLHIRGFSPAVLGSAPSNDNLYVAKFVANQGNWHGYPVAHWISPYDRPEMDILQSWINCGFVNRAKAARIHRGKKCAL